jgi:hypothetical protein
VGDELSHLSVTIAFIVTLGNLGAMKRGRRGLAWNERSTADRNSDDVCCATLASQRATECAHVCAFRFLACA